ncbi:MAG: hypothetical protein M0C28_29855 [Candidatus Moduliflexus flocculans]|nr:hypothetical protein [Candidatus Moduliflexus flocculans]
MKEDKIVEHAAAHGTGSAPDADRSGRSASVGGRGPQSIGLFGIIELVKDRKTKEPMAPWNGSSPEMAALRKYCTRSRAVPLHPLAYRVDHPAVDHHRGAVEGGI